MPARPPRSRSWWTRLAGSRLQIAGRGAPKATVPSGARRCRSYRRARMARSPAPAASDRPAPKRSTTRMAARQRPRSDAENCDGEVSFRTSLTSFDHLVGGHEQAGRHSEAEQSCGLGVDDQLELGRLQDWQVRGLGTLENSAGVDADLTPRIRNVGSVAHEPTDVGNLTLGIGRRNSTAHRLAGNVDAPTGEESRWADEEGGDPLAHKGCEG